MNFLILSCQVLILTGIVLLWRILRKLIWELDRRNEINSRTIMPIPIREAEPATVIKTDQDEIDMEIDQADENENVPFDWERT